MDADVCNRVGPVSGGLQVYEMHPQPKVLTSHEFGQAMALWRQQWEQEELEQRGVMLSMALFTLASDIALWPGLSSSLASHRESNSSRPCIMQTDSAARSRQQRSLFKLG